MYAKLYIAFTVLWKNKRDRPVENVTAQDEKLCSDYVVDEIIFVILLIVLTSHLQALQRALFKLKVFIKVMPEPEPKNPA